LQSGFRTSDADQAGRAVRPRLRGFDEATIVDPQWQSFGIEMFIAISLVYFAICFSMSKYSQHLEGRRHRGSNPKTI
jgi:hypothetical protein